MDFELSAGSVNFTPIVSVAKSSGYLGATGYTNIFIGADTKGAVNWSSTVRVYDTNGLSRSFP